MTPLIHNYSDLVGKTVDWDTSDNENLFQQNINDLQKRKLLEQNNFVNQPVEYKFNSHGFRSKEFDQPVDIVCFGCSFTMGTGIRECDTWPTRLEHMSGMTVYNLGHAGSSNDTAFRFANYYLKTLRPRFAVWLQAVAHRLELLDDHIPNSQNFLINDWSLASNHDYYLKTWFGSSSNHDLNLLKNTLAFKHLCNELDIKYIILPHGAMQSDRLARDLQHPGPKSHLDFAQKVYELIINPSKFQALNQ